MVDDFMAYDCFHTDCWPGTRTCELFFDGSQEMFGSLIDMRVPNN